MLGSVSFFPGVWRAGLPGGHCPHSMEEATSTERPRPLLLPCATSIYLPSFLLLGVFVGGGGVRMGLASLYNIIKHLQMIPGHLLAQLREHVKSDFFRIGEHLHLPQKLRTLFYLENYGQDLGFPMLAVYFPLLLCFPLPQKYSFMILL